MKLILSIKGGGQRQTMRLYCEGCENTDQLLQLISTKLGTPISSMYITTRLSQVLVRLIGGWSLDHYKIRDGKMINVQMNGKLSQQIEKGVPRGPSLTQIKKDYCTSFQEEEQAGLELQLNRFISLVEEGSSEEINAFLQAPPSFLSINSERATRQRNNFVLHELNSKGKAALHCAVTKQRIEVVALLLKLPVDVNARTTDDWTPLMLAVESGNQPVCELILNHSEIDVNQVTSKGSALHIASFNCARLLVQLLLEHEASQIVQNEEGKTPDEVCPDQQCIELITFWRSLNKSPDKNDQPVKVSGQLGLVKRVFHTVKPRFVVLDPAASKISIYRDPTGATKSLKQQISLVGVREVSVVQDQLWWMRKDLVYIALVTTSSRYFCTRYTSIAVKWVNCIQSACWYASNTDKDCREHFSYNSQLFLNSITNKILVRKLTITQPQPTRMKLRSTRKDRSFLNYSIIKQIGEGAFANVLLAKHKQSQDLFAVKVLDKRQLLSNGQLRYAYSEIDILERVKHPFVIQMKQTFETRDMLYLVLDYCPNGNLAEYLCDVGKVKEELARVLIAQIILAIEYLHDNQILYRDLKPQNILIGWNGYLKVTDFGLSKLTDRFMEAKTFCGSPIYTCPELLAGDTFTAASDIYGIGCILYEMLVGDPPFESDNLAKLYDKIKDGILKIDAPLSSQAHSLLKGLMDRNPLNRLTIKDTKDHPFFATIDWTAIEGCQFPGITVSERQQSEENSMDWNNDYEEDS